MQRRRQARVDLVLQCQALGQRLRPEFGLEAGEQFAERKSGGLLGVVVVVRACDQEQVIHHAEQVARRIPDLLAAFAQHLVADLALDLIVHPEDDVERRAQFVAYVGQENRLAAVRTFGGIARRHQFGGSRRDEFLEAVAVGFDLAAQALAIEQVLHALAGDLDVDRLQQVVGSAELEAVQLRAVVAERSDENDRNLRQQRVRLEQPAGLVAVHAGHHHVEQDQLRRRLGRHVERRLARGHELEGKLLVQRVGQHHQVGWRVIDDKNLGALRVHGGLAL